MITLPLFKIFPFYHFLNFLAFPQDNKSAVKCGFAKKITDVQIIKYSN